MSRYLLAGLLALTATAVQAATWTVDPARSKITFTGAQTGEPFSGAFKTFTAAIDFDPADPASAHARITVATGSATTGDQQKDEALPGADWFDVATFPQAVFEAKGFKAVGGDRYQADGTLTIRDVSRPVTLPFTLTTSGDTAHAVGEAKLLRSTFGVGQNAWAAEDYVAFAVTVGFDLTASRAK